MPGDSWCEHQRCLQSETQQQYAHDEHDVVSERQCPARVTPLRLGMRRELGEECVENVDQRLCPRRNQRGAADKLRYLNIAQGSLEESRYYLILAHDLGYLDQTGLKTQVAEVSRLLSGYIRGIEDRKE